MPTKSHSTSIDFRNLEVERESLLLNYEVNMPKPDLNPLHICTIGKMNKEHLRHAYKFIPNLRTRKDNFGPDETGRYHVCYLIVNLLDGRFYLGKHTFKRKPKGDSSYHGYSKHLWNSMKLHGEENFRMLILKYFKTWDEAYQWEDKNISVEMVRSQLCYNIKGGGKGWSGGDKHHIHAMVENGTLHLLKRPDGTSVASDLVKSGKHHLLKRKDGTSVTSDLVKSGKHHFLKRPDGTSVSSDRTKEGKNPFSGVEPWESTNSTVESRLTWLLAETIKKIAEVFPSYGGIKVGYILDLLLPPELSVKPRTESISVMIDKLSKGWSPTEDLSWANFKAGAEVGSKKILKLLKHVSSMSIKNLTVPEPKKPKPWNKNKTKGSEQTWINAQSIYKIHLKNPSVKGSGLFSLFNKTKEGKAGKASRGAFLVMSKMFEQGWIPSEDPEWKILIEVKRRGKCV